MMNVIAQGNMPHRRFNELIKLTGLRSPDVIEALRDHLCRNRSREMSSTLNDVEMSNFNRGFKKLNKVAVIVENIKDMDFEHLLKSRK